MGNISRFSLGNRETLDAVAPPHLNIQISTVEIVAMSGNTSVFSTYYYSIYSDVFIRIAANRGGEARKLASSTLTTQRPAQIKGRPVCTTGRPKRSRLRRGGTDPRTSPSRRRKPRTAWPARWCGCPRIRARPAPRRPPDRYPQPRSTCRRDRTSG